MINRMIFTGLSVITILFFSNCSHTGTKDSDSVSAIAVKTEMVQLTKGETSLRYSGTIEPSQTISLSFQSYGTIEKVLVEEGDIVHKGQVLAIVNQADSKSMYDASLASYKRAKDAYDRMKSLYEKGSLTEIKWVEMESNFKQAESQLTLAQSSLDKCIMRSPDNGVIGKRNIEPGQSALSTAATSPLELIKIGTINVKISVPENEIGKIKKGIKATFSISALEGKTFEGVVSNIGVVADMFSRTYEVKISATNPNSELKPGIVCDVVMDLKSEKELVTIPYQCVSKDKNGKTYVYVVDIANKRAKKQLVETGEYLGENLVVLSGLKPGETIVNEGKEKLSDNSEISL